MDRRTLVTFAAGACLLEPLAVRAQQAVKVFRIGLLVPRSEPTPADRIDLEALRTGLRDLGWVEGKNLIIEIRWANVNPQRQRELAAELKALPVALILAPGTATIHIVELTLRSHVPSIFGNPEYVAAGGLMSYLSSNVWHWRTAASFVDKILKGAMPADIPVEQPTKFELMINLKTAKRLGITIPQSLLARADELIR